MVKEFSVGKTLVSADFEGIAVARDTVVLITSGGRLFMFREGTDGERVGYTVHDPKLGRECEFEGVAFDPAIKSLLLICKNVYAKGLQRSLVIFRWKLERGTGDRLSRLAVPLDQVIGANPWKSLHPSDITVDPRTGNYVLVAAREKALVVITPRGDLITARPLPGKHEQAEGVALTRDSILIVSDEKGLAAAAALTLYRWPLTEPQRAP